MVSDFETEKQIRVKMAENVGRKIIFIRAFWGLGLSSKSPSNLRQVTSPRLAPFEINLCHYNVRLANSYTKLYRSTIHTEVQNQVTQKGGYSVCTFLKVVRRTRSFQVCYKYTQLAHGKYVAACFRV